MARNSSSNGTISDSKAKLLSSPGESVVTFKLQHSCMGVATLRHILCFIYGLKLLLAQRSSKKYNSMLHPNVFLSIYLSAEPEALGLEG